MERRASLTDSRNEGSAESTDGQFRPTKLRSSLRRKMSSIFKRPVSYHADATYDKSLSFSSQSLCSSQGINPSLDHFLETVYNPEAAGVPHESLLEPRLSMNPLPDFSLPTVKEEKKSKEIKSYLKRAANKHREKITTSFAAFSTKMREKSFFKRSPGQSSKYDCPKSAGGNCIRNGNAHDSAFRRNNFRWSVNVPGDYSLSSAWRQMEQDLPTQSCAGESQPRYNLPPNQPPLLRSKSEFINRRTRRLSHDIYPFTGYPNQSTEMDIDFIEETDLEYSPCHNPSRPESPLNIHKNPASKSCCNVRDAKFSTCSYSENVLNTSVLNRFHSTKSVTDEPIYENINFYYRNIHSQPKLLSNEYVNTYENIRLDPPLPKYSLSLLPKLPESSPAIRPKGSLRGNSSVQVLKSPESSPAIRLKGSLRRNSSVQETRFPYEIGSGESQAEILSELLCKINYATECSENNELEEVHEISNVQNVTVYEATAQEILRDEMNDSAQIRSNNIPWSHDSLGYSDYKLNTTKNFPSLPNLSLLTSYMKCSNSQSLSNISKSEIRVCDLLKRRKTDQEKCTVSDPKEISQIDSHSESSQASKILSVDKIIPNLPLKNRKSSLEISLDSNPGRNFRKRKRKQRRRKNKKNARLLAKQASDNKCEIDLADMQMTDSIQGVATSESVSPSDLQLVYLSTLISPPQTEYFALYSEDKLHQNSLCDTTSEINGTTLNVSLKQIEKSSPGHDEVDDFSVPQDEPNHDTGDIDSSQGIHWILTEGEECLTQMQCIPNTLTGISKQSIEFNEFYRHAKIKINETLALLDEKTEEKASEKLTKILNQHVASFGDRLNLSKENLEDTAKCYLLLDKAYEWALQSMKVVGVLKGTSVASPEQINMAAKTIASHLEANPPLSEDTFDTMQAIASKLNNHILLQQCKVAQARCQETVNLLQSRQAALMKVRRQAEFDNQSFVDLRELLNQTELEENPWVGSYMGVKRKSFRAPLSVCSSLDLEEDFLELRSSTPSKQTLEGRTSLGNIKELHESCEDMPNHKSVSRSSSIWYPPLGRVLSSGSSSCSSENSEDKKWRLHRTNSQLTEDCTDSLLEESLPLSNISIKSIPPSSANSHLLIRGSQINLSNSEDLTQDEIKKNKTIMLIMQELKHTEKDYVNSLEYIIENYIPELLRDDIPQALRGQRNVIFGNIEKIYEFHSGRFLGALESCQDRPLSVASIFLKYEQEFYLYALYNKNKPKSDGLMAEYGSSFFKTKQMDLGDCMDLSSYLLKPVQRMGKYALLLKQLLKECSRGEEGYEELAAAQEMVQFQLRHGNDLLAMDSLRECDVNLKEQGRLLRQGELMVCEGTRKKSMRHVFLFEDLILFSKSRKDPDKRTLDIFQYKHSIKMSDIGLTERIGDCPNKFEIWFRKRKPSDTYLLQATSVEVKELWTEEISKVLWRQALKNRSLRLHEMSSMGIGNKPCLDIRASEDQICDRSVCIGQFGVPPSRLRNEMSIDTVISRRPHSVISVSSSASSGASSGASSSQSGTGTLNQAYEPGDYQFSLHRSVTRTSQCSAESGILTDISSERHYKVERSNSSITTISGESIVSPTNSTAISMQCSLVRDGNTSSLVTTEV